MTCTTCQCSHDDLKRDAARWESLPLANVWLVDAEDSDSGKPERWDVRHLPCNSTLTKVEVAA